MLTFNVILLPGVPGLPIPRLILVFFLGFFFFQSDRPTQYQETSSTLNEKKGGMALETIKSNLT